MKKFKCRICGHIEESSSLPDDYICPICGVDKSNFEELNDNFFDLEIDAIIDSVIEETFDEKTSKIINFLEEDKRVKIGSNHCINRIDEKCINCGQCKKTCENIVNISYDLNKCREPICIGCGQCILNCPTGAMTPKYSYKDVKNIIDLNEKIVVALISPAVRVSLGEMFNMEPGEKVIAITSLHRKTDAEFVLFITKQGLIKKTTIEEYMKVKRSTGSAAIKLKDGDSIANVTFVKDEDIILITKKGMSIHFTTKDITPIGRVTAGVKAIKLNEGDEVLGGFPVHKKTDCIATFSEKGLGKKTPITDFTVQGRGGKGVMIYKPSTSTGDLVGAALISDEDSLLLIGKPNSICISAVDVPNLSRTSQGNIMIKNSSILSVIKL